MLKLDEELEAFDRTLAEIKRVLASLTPQDLNQKSIAWVFAILKRSQDMIYTADASIKVGHYVSGCLLIRGLIENAAILNGFERHCRQKLDCTETNVYVDEIAMKFILSSRANTSREQAVNILTHLDKYAKETNPSIRETYDHLSNWCHPNFEGTFNPFVEIIDGQMRPNDKPSVLDTVSISSCLPISIASVRIESVKAIAATLPSDIRQKIEAGYSNPQA
jgi:hypothetical protein